MTKASHSATLAPESPVCLTLSEDEQIALCGDILQVLEHSPFYRPVLPRWGTPFSVLMSNCGPLGWISDKSGYRYSTTHPETGKPWAQMPGKLSAIWAQIAAYDALPEACLINYYAPNAKMGLHQDKDEMDFAAPVVSVSLGDDARFRLGGDKRDDPTASFVLKSGDVMLLSGETRLAFHGIDRIYEGTSELPQKFPALFPEGGRLNLTLRRVNPA